MSRGFSGLVRGGAGGALSIALLAAGCASVPVTNRSQLQLVSSGQMAQMSSSEYGKVIAKGPLSKDREQVALVKRVGRRIAASTEAFVAERGLTETFDWEFNLIEDDKQVNAWCMPGGKVAFYTGILPYCQGEKGVAVVMGHEVAHALARHGSERFSQAMLAQLGTVALAQAMRDRPKQTQQLVLLAAGAGTQLGVLLPYSRLHEYEADEIGLFLMARAGYDPREAVAFWERMAAAGKGKPPEFLSTHPADGNRIARLRELMPGALAAYREAGGR